MTAAKCPICKGKGWLYWFELTDNRKLSDLPDYRYRCECRTKPTP